MAAFGTLTPQEQAEVPPSWLDRFIKHVLPFDWQGVTLNRSQDTPEYTPGMPLSGMLTPGAVQQGIDAGMAVSGGGLATKPPVLATYHGTGAPKEFSRLRPPEPTHDIGIHTTIDPEVASGYAYPSINAEKKYGVGPITGASAGVRIKPVLTDVQSALKYPADAGKWNDPVNVIQMLEEGMRAGFQAPRGLLSDMYNIAGSREGWRKDFVPMLKERGYDSLYYPHESELTGKKYNTFMAFEPEQVIPRFSQEGQKLIRERGVHEPMRSIDEPTPWRLPPGILRKGPTEGADVIPTVQRAMAENPSFQDSQAQQMLKVQAAHHDLVTGKITSEEYLNLFSPPPLVKTHEDAYLKAKAEAEAKFNKPKSPMFGKPK